MIAYLRLYVVCDELSGDRGGARGRRRDDPQQQGGSDHHAADGEKRNPTETRRPALAVLGRFALLQKSHITLLGYVRLLTT